MENSTKNIKMVTNTEVAIAQAVSMIKTNFKKELSEIEVKLIEQYLNNIANAKKLDILNQINNLK